MHNVITSTTEISILDRAIKGRDRRDRDGKNRRPVTDSLIEYAKNLRDENSALSSKNLALEQKIEVLSDVISKQSSAMEAMDSEIAELKAPSAVESIEQDT